MKKTLLFAFIFFTSITKSYALHVAGGNISFSHLGNKRYEIELSVIRDCSGNQVSNTSINVRCVNGAFNVTLPLVSKKDVTGIGKQCNTQSKCTGSYQIGLEESLYRGVVDLSTLQCCEVTISWQQIGRTQRSTISSSFTNLYLEAVINICAGASMVWSKIPSKKLFYLGRDEMVNYSIAKVDGNDSVSYELVRPLSSQGVSASYSGSFSYYRPMSFLGYPNVNLNSPAGFHFDKTSGNLKFRPVRKNETSQIAIKATAWRRINGVMAKVGTTITDQPIFIIDQAFSSNPIQKANDVFNTCLGDTSVAVIEVNDLYKKNSYSVNLSHTLQWAEARFVSKNGSRFIIIRYLADSIKTIDKTNALTIEIEDDNCPISGKSIRSYGIRADSALTKFTDSSSVSKSTICNEVTFYHLNKSTNTDIEYYWSIIQNNDDKIFVGDTITYTAKDTGWVKAALIAYSKKYCNAFVYRDSIYISNNNFVRVSAIGGETCNSMPFNVTATAMQGVAPYTYSWSTNQTGKSVALNVLKGNKIYTVTATDSNGCENTDTLRIINYHPTITLVGDTLTCKGGKVNLTANIKDTISNPKYSWSGYPQQQKELKDSITVAKTYTFTLSEANCSISKSFRVKISQPKATFIHDSAVCQGQSIKISAVPKGGRSPYSVFWNSYQKTGANIFVSTQNARIGGSSFAATITDDLGCTGFNIGSFTILPTPTINLTNLSPLCENNASYSLHPFATPQGGIWQGNGISNNSINASIAGIGLSELKYTYTNNSGCSDSALTYIKVYAQPTIDFTADSIEIFKGSKVSFTNTTQADTTIKSWWNFGDNGKAGNIFFGTNGSYVYNDTGEYAVTLRIDNGVCAPDSIIKVNYIIVKSQATNPNISVKEVNQHALKLYPNPVKDKLTIEAENDITSITLIDVLGKKYEVENFIQSTTPEINITHLPKGVYFIEVLDENGNKYSSKLLITR